MPLKHYPFSHMIVTVLSVLSLLSACVPGGSIEQSASSHEASAATPGSEVAQPSGVVSAGDEGEARFVDGPMEDVLGDLPALGSMTFTLDATHQASGEFTPGGPGLVLSLTDAAGLTWMLSLPSGALDKEETITMTALVDVRSDDIPGSLLGGVLLEPDGLRLMEPGTLAVAGDGLEDKALFLGGSHDGTGVNFALPNLTGAGSEAVIEHFSSYTVIHSDDPQITELRDQGSQHYKELSKKGRELLKNKQINVPRPPAIPLHCPKDDEEAGQRAEALRAFEEAFRKPESDLLVQLMATQTSLSQMGVKPDFTLEVRLLERSIKKVNLLIKQYGDQAENVNAITQVGMRVAREMTLLNQSHPGSVEVMEALGRMSERAIDELLKELREEHEYRNVGPILDLSRRAALFSVGTIPLDDLMARIESALQFKMKLNWEMGIEGESRYIVEGEFPMRSNVSEAPIGTLLGSGKAEMISAKFDSDEDWFVESVPFQVNAIITGFDACKSTAYLSVDRLYPDVENHFTLDSDGEVMEIGPMPLMQIAWDALYEDRKKTGPTWYGEVDDYYTFELQLRNSDVVAVYDMIETIDVGETGTLLGWLSVTLTHTPK